MSVLGPMLRTGHVGPRTMVVTGGNRRHRPGPGGHWGTPRHFSLAAPAPALQPTLNTERVAGELVTREYTVCLYVAVSDVSCSIYI